MGRMLPHSGCMTQEAGGPSALVGFTATPVRTPGKAIEGSWPEARRAIVCQGA